MNILIAGSGGIGGVCASQLLAAGQPVTVYSTNKEIAATVNRDGFRLVGVDRPIPGKIVTALPEERFDYVILATQPPQVEEAARELAPLLSQRGALVCLQNGLCEDRLERIAPGRVIGAIVGWGASMPAPGVYEQTAPGGFTLGRMDGRADARVEELARLLAPVGDCDITENLAGKRWSKLALNCAISSLGAIGGDRVGELMQIRSVRRLALEIMTEVVEVARVEGVRLEKVSGTLDLDWVALSAEERRSTGSPSLLAKHSLLLAVGFRYRRMRSSMLSALERGRPPAVDFLNGEIVTRGAARGVATPVNAAVQQMVWEIARGERASSVESLRELFGRTKALRP